MTGHCACCGLDRDIVARGLCNACYVRHGRANTLSQSPAAPRLTDEQVTAIVERYRAGDRIIDLAAEMGVSDSAIIYRLRRAGVELRGRRRA